MDNDLIFKNHFNKKDSDSTTANFFFSCGNLSSKIKTKVRLGYIFHFEYLQRKNLYFQLTKP